MEYEIFHIMEHVEVYKNNVFCFSSDTEKEALKEIKETGNGKV